MKKPVPDLHFLMILIACALLVLCMIFYFFAPAAKAEAFATLMATLVGFLTGKFTNGFRTAEKKGTE